MESVEPIVVVLGPFGGGTSAVAKVLHHLGVFMGTDFDWTYREPHDTWEESYLSRLCRRAFSEPGGRLQMDTNSLRSQLRDWADGHRSAARSAGSPPGVKHPLLCVAVDLLRDSWGPIVPVAVDRPVEKVVASLNRLGWWADEQEREESTTHLIRSRDNAIRDTASVRVDFEALRDNPEVVIRRLADDLGLQITDAQLKAAVSSVMDVVDVVHDANPHGLDLLLTDVERNFDDTRSVYIWAQSYFDSCDFANARKWYARQIELGGFTDEETYFAMWRLAESMAHLDEPWPDVQDAYLKAWNFRPTRAEPLHAIARRYRTDGRYLLGRLFAERAAQLPLPEEDIMLSDSTVYAWRAADEQAVCASGIGEHAEAFQLCRKLLTRSDIPEHERRRIAANRDFVAARLATSITQSPAELAEFGANDSGHSIPFASMDASDVAFSPGQIVRFAGTEAVVVEVGERNGQPAYLVNSGDVHLPMWLPANVLASKQRGRDTDVFIRAVPHILAVDNFFDDPDEIRAIALAQEYGDDLRFFKGLRSKQRFLWPHMREELGRLLGTPVTEWLSHSANGVFQQTSHHDPLVWHHDTQSYAAAVYLTPDAPPQSGTSFWRDRVHGCRRRPDHPFERRRLGSNDAVAAASSVVYDPYNIEHSDNWELMESVAGLYNRLVIWDAALFHSATTYDHFTTNGAAPIRLVQLFFFDI